MAKNITFSKNEWREEWLHIYENGKYFLKMPKYSVYNMKKLGIFYLVIEYYNGTYTLQN